MRPAALVSAVPTAGRRERGAMCAHGRTPDGGAGAEFEEPGGDGEREAEDAEGEAEERHQNRLVILEGIEPMAAAEVVGALGPGAGARRSEPVDHQERQRRDDDCLLLHSHGGARRMIARCVQNDNAGGVEAVECYFRICSFSICVYVSACHVAGVAAPRVGVITRVSCTCSFRQ